ncbi:MAG: hypothetical protein RR212_10880 [Bacteroidales bacterium]
MEEFKGVSHLADILKSMANDTIEYNGPVVDFGTIQGDGSLKTNASGIVIPINGYLICGNLLNQNCSGSTSNNQGHEHSAIVSYPKRVSNGSKVLVLWVGNDAVVIDVIHEASEVI